MLWFDQTKTSPVQTAVPMQYPCWSKRPSLLKRLKGMLWMNEYPLRDKHGRRTLWMWYLRGMVLSHYRLLQLPKVYSHMAAFESIIQSGWRFRERLIHHMSFPNSVHLIFFVSKSSHCVSKCIYAHVDIINNRVCALQGMPLWDLLAAILAGPACQLQHSGECFIVRPYLPGDTSTRSGPLFVCVIFIILQ